MESGFVLDRRTRALWVLRILVACRVSVLSVAAGTLLFLLAAQARDLFADTAFGALPASPGAWGFWIAFFTYLVFVWAFPVHYAARQCSIRTPGCFRAASGQKAGVDGISELAQP